MSGLLDQGASRFRYSTSFSNTKTNDDYSWITSFILGYTASADVFIQGSFPFKEIHYEPTGTQYDFTGPGDASLMVNYNLSSGLFGWGAKKDQKEKTDEDPLAEKKEKEAAPSIPQFSFALTLSLPTGSYEDKSKTPPFYQLGTGAVDTTFTLSYFQVFGKWTPYASLGFTMSDTLSMTLYDRADKATFSAGTRWTVDPDHGGILMGAVVGQQVLGDDSYVDSLSIKKTLVTQGMYTYLQVGYMMQVVEHMDMTISTQFSLTQPDLGETSGNSAAMDYNVSITLGYKF